MNGDPLQYLHEQLMLLFQDLREIVPSEKRGLLQIVENVFSMMPKENLMNHVVLNILPHKEQINSKNQDFFLNNKQLFGSLPENEVNYFGNLIVNGNLDDDEKDMIWEYFKVFIALAEVYKKSI